MFEGNKKLKVNPPSSSLKSCSNNASVFSFLNTMNPDKIVGAGRVQTKTDSGKMLVKNISRVKESSSKNTKNLF